VTHVLKNHIPGIYVSKIHISQAHVSIKYIPALQILTGTTTGMLQRYFEYRTSITMEDELLFGKNIKILLFM